MKNFLGNPISYSDDDRAITMLPRPIDFAGIGFQTAQLIATLLMHFK